MNYLYNVRAPFRKLLDKSQNATAWGNEKSKATRKYLPRGRVFQRLSVLDRKAFMRWAAQNVCSTITENEND